MSFKEIRASAALGRVIADNFYSLIKSSVSELEYDFWFRELDIITVIGSHFLIEVKTAWQKEWITTYYGDLFFDSLDKAAMGAESTCEIHVLDQAK